jgi:hypothetical protein
MASIRQSIRSSTASKRPTSAIADGQIALNTASGTPGLFFKDSAGNIIKTGPAHYGASAPNSSPAVGGSTGNSIGEAWLDSSLTPAGWKIWNGSAWVNATPLSSDTVQGLVELATNAETQAGADTARAVTSAGLQSKVSDSISTASSSGIASSSAVKTAYDLANAALPKSGGIITGNLEIGSTGSLTFEGSTADGFETTLAVVDPTLDRTITFPNITGTVVTTGDTGTVTSTMILDGTIVDADINASAEIAVSKLADGAARQLLQTDAAGTGVEWASNIDIPGTLDVTSAATFDSTVAVTGALTKSGNNVVTVGDTGTVTSTMILDGTILNADVNASAAIAGTKISPDFGAQTIVTTGVHSAAAGSAAAPSITFTGDLNTGIYSPGADQVAISTNGTGRLFVSSTGDLGVNTGGTQATKLHVIGGNVWSGNFYEVARFQKSSGTAVSLGFDNTAYVATIGAYSHDGTASNLSFWTYPGSGSVEERLRITSAGLVGVGTSAPSQALNVVGNIALGATLTGGVNGTAYSILGNSATSGNANGGSVNIVAGAGSGAGTNGNISISAGSTVSPASVTTGGSVLITSGKPSDAQAGGTIDFRYYSGNPSTLATAMCIDSSGRVGIGTTSPLFPLDVNGVIYTRGRGSTFGVLFDDWRIYNSTAPGALVFDNGSERARIDSSGRLLVGTSSERTNVYYTTVATTPKVQFETSGSSYSNGLSLIQYSASGFSPVLTLGLSASNTPGTNTAIASTHDLGAINFAGNDGTNFRTGASIICTNDQASAWAVGDCPGRLVFSTTADGAASPTEAMRINNQRELLIGTTTRTANGGVLQVSNGITFPATQVACTDPNTLDDYEEGTWTPALKFGGSSVSMTGTYAGKYVKVGKVVYYSLSITLTAKGSSTGNTTITGLPFTNASGGNENYSTTIAFMYNGLGLTGPLMPRVDLGLTSLDVFQNGATGYATVSQTNFANDSQIQAFGFYFI